MLIDNTAEFFEELTKATLTNSGWEVEEKKGFIYAQHPNRTSIFLCVVGRCLSDVNSKETPMISAKMGKISKMMESMNEIADKPIPCISFGVAKFSMDNFEIAIVPLKAIEDNAKSCSVYSITKNGYFYNYTQIHDTEIPKDAILRKTWSSNF